MYLLFQTIIEKVEYEVQELKNYVSKSITTVFNPAIQFLNEDLISKLALQELIDSENINLIMEGKKIALNASDCFNE